MDRPLHGLAYGIELEDPEGVGGLLGLAEGEDGDDFYGGHYSAAFTNESGFEPDGLGQGLGKNVFKQIGAELKRFGKKAQAEIKRIPKNLPKIISMLPFGPKGAQDEFAELEELSEPTPMAGPEIPWVPIAIGVATLGVLGLGGLAILALRPRRRRSAPAPVSAPAAQTGAAA